MTRTIEDCKTCDCFISMYNIDTVLCGRIECKSIVQIQPSFYNEGIENSKLVINCLK